MASRDYDEDDVKSDLLCQNDIQPLTSKHVVVFQDVFPIPNRQGGYELLDSIMKKIDSLKGDVNSFSFPVL